MWTAFKNLSEKDIQELMISLKEKSFVLDPIPTSLLTDYLDVMLPVITKIINTSPKSGYFSDLWKTAVVNPLQTAPGLDLHFQEYRPVNNI